MIPLPLKFGFLKPLDTVLNKANFFLDFSLIAIYLSILNEIGKTRRSIISKIPFLLKCFKPKFGDFMIDFDEIRVVATDIDGTLTTHDYLLDIKVIESIRQLEKVGIKIILISGNVFPAVSALSQYIGTSGPIVAENGCVVGFKWEPILVGKPIKGKEKLIKIMKSLGFIEAPTNKFRFIDLAFKRTEESKSISEDELFRTLYKKGFKDIEISDSGFAVHITPKGLNKGVGLKKALELINVDPKHVIAIGDGGNDLPLFEVVGFSVAVKNAPDFVKERVDLVLDEENGKGFRKLAKLILENRFRKH